MESRLQIFFFFPGLVRLYIASLPLRSCPDPWATFCGGGRFCQQQDLNPRSGAYHASVLPLLHFDHPRLALEAIAALHRVYLRKVTQLPVGLKIGKRSVTSDKPPHLRPKCQC